MTSIVNMKTPVAYGSSTYVVLCYLKMKRCPVSVDDYRKFCLHKSKPSDIVRSFDVLVRHSFAKYTLDNKIIITSLGIEYLYLVARKVESGCTGTKNKEDAILG